MHDYFYSVFPNQLKTLSYLKPPQYLSEMHHLGGALFFGGSDWENAATDLARVPPEDRPRFVLSLFMIVLTDQALFTHNTNAYDEWRRRTNFPKFGWFGFGVHNENPFKLLSVPEQEGLVDAEEIIAAMPEFVDFFIAESTKMLVDAGLLTEIGLHFESIRSDPAYAFGEGKVVPAFKSAFDAAL